MPSNRTVPRLRLTLEVVGSRPEKPPLVVYQREHEAEHYEQHELLKAWLLELASISAGREEARLRALLGIQATVHIELPAHAHG